MATTHDAADSPGHAISFDGPVVSFSGTEGISQLFRFDFEVALRNLALDLAGSVGQTAAFAIGPQRDRPVHGLVSRLEQGALVDRLARNHVRLVPRVWTLTRRTDSRIFQNLNVKDVVEQVLGAAGIAAHTYRFELVRSYNPREISIQYQESDWDFVSRLLEDEGIYYYFEHSASDHVLVFADDRSVLAGVNGGDQVTYLPEGVQRSGATGFVSSFRFGDSVHSGAVHLLDYNFEVPGGDLNATAAGARFPNLQVFEYPGGYLLGGRGQDLVLASIIARQDI